MICLKKESSVIIQKIYKPTWESGKVVDILPEKHK